MISTTGRYALRLMIDLAKTNSHDYVPLKDIATRQQISKKYLEIIVKDLVDAKLLKGASGKGGGYKLSKRVEDYSVGEILQVTETSLSVVACLSENAEECPLADRCETLPMWKEYDALVKKFFFSKKLIDLIK